jgi:asparagine synthase (glutamine-hydrolysing)
LYGALKTLSLDFEQTAAELRKLIFEIVGGAPGDSILLSGGLDTSIIGAVESSLNRKKIHAFTIILKDAPAPDLDFSKLAAKQFGFPQKILSVSMEEIEDFLPDVVRVLRSFDPMEVRNSVVVFMGLREAQSEGFAKVLTGDVADELFAGYSFVYNLQRDMAQATLEHLWEVMHFSSIPLAKSLGIEALLPFLDDRVLNFATTSVPFEFLIGKSRSDPSGQVFGKYVLRQAFEDLLPKEICWRTKTPIETGSGTTVLPMIYADRIKDVEFVNKKNRFFQKDGVRIRDKEQLHYYEIFRGEFGPPAPDMSTRICPACTSNVPDAAVFCTTCGEFPI